MTKSIPPDGVVRPSPGFPRRCDSLDCGHLETEHSPGQGCDRCPCAAFTIQNSRAVYESDADADVEPSLGDDPNPEADLWLTSTEIDRLSDAHAIQSGLNRKPVERCVCGKTTDHPFGLCINCYSAFWDSLSLEERKSAFEEITGWAKQSGAPRVWHEEKVRRWREERLVRS